MPHRIYTTVSDEVYQELEKRRKEKGHRNIQDVVRDIITEWYEGRKQEITESK
ncbi:MAG TPA: hypothetical protein VMV49_12305 [Candidatus Deferrimicrobium sp.]|nr:hypothetical protein [Candidatus Deferrimicrobium sp.]